MDMKLGEDFYDSFVEYQKKILDEFDLMSKEFNFKVLDASRNFEETNRKLKEGILQVLKDV
jgi:thymidylate kinase